MAVFMLLLVIHSVISLGTLLAHENKNGFFCFFFKSGMQVQLGRPLIKLLFVFKLPG